MVVYLAHLLQFLTPMFIWKTTGQRDAFLFFVFFFSHLRTTVTAEKSLYVAAEASLKQVSEVYIYHETMN